MYPVQAKSPEEIEKLAEGFASGQLFTGLHIALSKDYPDKKKALLTCFLPLNTYSLNEWAEYQLAQWVPYAWVKDATTQLSKLPPLYVFPSFEFMTIADGIAVVRYAGEILKRRLNP